jgi:hypothetical protein
LNATFCDKPTRAFRQPRDGREEDDDEEELEGKRYASCCASSDIATTCELDVKTKIVMTYENPKVTQFDIEKPKMFMIISMTMSLPRQLAFEVSPCHTGAVDVLIPFPMPATMRPTIISGTLNDAIWIMAPMLMIVVPKRTQFFRPRGSPITQTRIAPKKHPMS